MLLKIADKVLYLSAERIVEKFSEQILAEMVEFWLSMPELLDSQMAVVGFTTCRHRSYREYTSGSTTVFHILRGH